ncbi:MAG TPA: metallophosphoesterase family protein, partial [Kofleriaceae bacterium]|nr:metallophosphoesterase family protein [Kofleriaceae bacterium]
WLIQSFEYDPDEMFYGRYMVQAMIETINQEVRRQPERDPARPSFVIHTGDLIDAGVDSEASIVHSMIDQLAIPFFDAIGNHDVLVFGNLLPATALARATDDDGCVSAGSVIAPYLRYFRRHRPRWLPTRLCAEAAPGVTLLAEGTHARSLRRFIRSLEHDEATPIPALVDRGPGSECRGEKDIASNPLTLDHGFDLNADKGYYGFAQSLTLDGVPRHALFLVLDSMDLLDGEGGNVGRVREPQLQWLQRALACAEADDLIFVFAHHGLSEIVVGDGLAPRRPGPSRLEELLVAHNQQHHNIVAFLFGHHHVHEICKDPRPTACASFWEVQTASIVDYPQEGRLVRIKDAGHGLAFLELTSFGPHLAGGSDEFSRALAIAHHGAERDYCRTVPGARCSETLEPYRTDGHDTYARLFFVLPGYPRPD